MITCTNAMSDNATCDLFYMSIRHYFLFDWLSLAEYDDSQKSGLGNKLN